MIIYNVDKMFEDKSVDRHTKFVKVDDVCKILFDTKLSDEETVQLLIDEFSENVDNVLIRDKKSWNNI